MREEGGPAEWLTAAQAAFDFGSQQAAFEERLGMEMNDSLTPEKIRGL